MTEKDLALTMSLLKHLTTEHKLGLGSNQAEDAEVRNQLSDGSVHSITLNPQVDIVSSPETRDVAEKSSPPTSQPTSESSLDLLLPKSLLSVEPPINGGDSPEHSVDFLKQMPYLVKFYLDLMLRTKALPSNFITMPEARQLASLPAQEALTRLKELCPPEKDSIAKMLTSRDSFAVCKELDREKELLEAGSSYLYVEEDKYTGGRCNFRGDAYMSQENQVEVRLKAVCLVQRSSRFTRRFGSERFFRLNVRKTKKGQEGVLLDFLAKPFNILDRQFKVLFIKEKSSFLWTVTFFEYRQDMSSIWDFFDWHGPWLENTGSLLLRFIQRLHLGLSASSPGLYIPKESVRYMNDLFSKTGEVMTDGAGLISRGALIKVGEALGLPNAPSAVQGRYDGAKGMWIIDPESSVDEIWIGITESQRKLIRQDATDVAHQYLDVLNVPEVSTPCYLAKQSIIVMDNNGVGYQRMIDQLYAQMHVTMDDLMGQAGRKEVGVATDAEGVSDAPAIEAGANGAHLPRTSASVPGTVEDYTKPDFDEGQTIFETIFDMLTASSEVSESSAMKVHFAKAVTMVLNRFLHEFRISVPRSAELFVVPDRSGLLEEGEVQISFGPNGPIDPTTEERSSSLVGDVILFRSPALLPSDMQKVKAVTHPALAHHTKVLLVSTKGKSPFMKKLSNGDYDGDKVTIIWEPTLVEPFFNAVDKMPSVIIQDVFTQDSQTVAAFLEKISGGDKEKQLLDLILEPLHKPSSKGDYGRLHQVAQYMRGCDSQDAIDLAFKFTHIMDGVKNGTAIRTEILDEDEKAFKRNLPRWSMKKGIYYPGPDDPNAAKRDEGLGQFILDGLYKTSTALIGKCNASLEMVQQSVDEFDEDLGRRWEEFTCRNASQTSQEQAISEHCRSALTMHEEARLYHAALREKYGPDSASHSEKARDSVSPGEGQSTTLGDVDIQEVPTFAQIRQYFADWMLDDEKAFRMAGRGRPEASTEKLSDVIDAEEMNALKDLVLSCLYVQACKKVEDGEVHLTMHQEKVAFDVGAYSMFKLKVKEKASRLGLEGLSLTDYR